VVLETDPGRARDIARKRMAHYFGLPNYVNNWIRYGCTWLNASNASISLALPCSRRATVESR
jgi:hypothetical protein